MKDIKNEYKSFLDDIEKNIKDKEDLEYIKKRVTDFIDIVLEKINYITEYKDEEIKKLEQSQQQIEEKMSKMQETITNIEKNIYEEDGFDFEIICPYCNAEFITDINEDKNEIECPECNNIIELDWSGDIDDNSENGCQDGNCHGCHGCDFDEDDDM